MVPCAAADGAFRTSFNLAMTGAVVHTRGRAGVFTGQTCSGEGHVSGWRFGVAADSAGWQKMLGEMPVLRRRLGRERDWGIRLQRRIPLTWAVQWPAGPR